MGTRNFTIQFMYEEVQLLLLSNSLPVRFVKQSEFSPQKSIIKLGKNIIQRNYDTFMRQPTLPPDSPLSSFGICSKVFSTIILSLTSAICAKALKMMIRSSRVFWLTILIFRDPVSPGVSGFNLKNSTRFFFLNESGNSISSERSSFPWFKTY